MSGVEAAITSGSMSMPSAAAVNVSEPSYLQAYRVKASDSPVASFVDKISGVDSNNFISPDFSFIYRSDLIINDEDYDAIGEGNMAVLKTEYPPESFRSDDETGYDAYNPVQGFSINFPRITSAVPGEDEEYSYLSDYDRIIFIQYHSSEADALKTKLGTGELQMSTTNITHETMDTIISQLAEQLQNTNMASDYVAKTIEIPRLTAADFLQEGTEVSTSPASAVSPSSPSSAPTSTPTTSGGSY